MTQLTKNFKRKEFACKCGCGFDTVDFALLEALQHCVYRFTVGGKSKVSMEINCGCRCVSHNKKVGGADKSLHLFGRAADVQLFVDGAKVLPKTVYDFFEENYPDFGIGIYDTFTHVDTRTGPKARFDYRSKK